MKQIRLPSGLALAVVALLCLGATDASAANRLTGLGMNNTSSNTTTNNSSSSTSQTSTAATTATSQSAQVSILAQHAAATLQKSIQALQAQQAAQNAARAAALNASSSVPNGLTPGGLVPGIKGVDPVDPSTIAINAPVTVNTDGTSSVTIAAGAALTLPPSLSGSEKITISGSGTVGSITTGGTITTLTGGVATTVAPGSTISLPEGGTVTFASGAPVPKTVSTYNYGTSSAPAAVPASWSGVSGLSQSTYVPTGSQTTGPTTVTITQSSQQALLTWQSFNIGKDTTLDFDQSAGGANVGQWVAINKVAPSVAPSQILGNLQAPGQVYVINQNGIIFGGSSQVNTGALVASSLPINDNLVARGLLNNPDDQFLFSQLTVNPIPQGAIMPAFVPPAGPTAGNGDTVAQRPNGQVVAATGQNGDVVVEAGAQLNSPTTPEHVGGKIALVGPNVYNSGTITSPDGQVIMAAGLQVAFTAHNSNDPTLRGLDVEVGKVANSSYDGGATGVAGTATNLGYIEVPRGDTTIVGMNVNQDGLIDSSTSVSLNGRIDLLADYNAAISILVSGASTVPVLTPTATGNLTFGPGSTTQILPELSSTDEIVGTELALSSIVNLQGKNIDFGANSTLLAPGASTPSTSTAVDFSGAVLSSGVTVGAGAWLPVGQSYGFYNTTGQITVENGASIDVSGSQNVSASVAEDIVAAQLLGTELANSPLQQNGPLRGQTVDVNLLDTGVSSDGTAWIGTPVGDVSGYVNLVERTVGELTTNGGTISMKAGQAVNLNSGSTINVSGGWINYQGANIQTTKVVENGQVVDISTASPDQVYEGIYTGYNNISAKWGITQNYANALAQNSTYVAGYIQGGNGGTLSITAPSMTFNGNLYGNTVAGANQRTLASQLSATYAGTNFLPTILATQAIPLSGTLSLSLLGQNGSLTGYPTQSPSPAPTVVFSLTPIAGDMVLSPDLINVDGFANFSLINETGNVTIPADVTLQTAAGGSVNISAGNLDIEGDIISPGGQLNLTAFGNASSGLGEFTLGSSAALSTAGLVVDDRITSLTANLLPIATNGGSITIDGYDTTLMSGSTVNVSGGLYLSAANKQTFGKGGSITVEGGQDATLNYVLDGQLNLGSNYLAGQGFLGFSGVAGGGGSLAIQAPLVQLGGQSLLNPDSNTTTLWLNQTDAQGNLLFFSQGGFGNYKFVGLGDPNAQNVPAFQIAPGTVIDPVAQSWQPVLATVGNDINLTPVVYPLASERSPVNLTFSAPGVVSLLTSTLTVRGDIVMGEGSSIKTDPKGSVTLSGNTVAVLGSIIAPGGKISISGGKDSTSLFPSAGNVAVATVDLGPDSLLSTAGTFEQSLNVYGYMTGTVLPGGTISVGGNIVAEAGSVLDVSGASHLVDLVPAAAGTPSNASPSAYQMTRAQLDSSGGSITLSGGQELFTDATLLGAASGPTAQGGSLSITSGRFYASGAALPTDETLIVTQSGSTIPMPAFYPSGQTAIGHDVVDTKGHYIQAQGYFAADSFDSSGMSQLTLNGIVQFNGPVNLAASRSITVGTEGIVYANAAVNLIAPYVDLGLPFQAPVALTQQDTSPFQQSGSNFPVPPTYGTGSLNVSATDLIDVGNLSLQGIGLVNFNSGLADAGDVRGDGTLDVSGNINITAAQIYPTTESFFNIITFQDKNAGSTLSGNVAFYSPGGVLPSLPLSAGGILNVYADNIVQDGVLRAPDGTINLGSGVTSSTPVDIISGRHVDATAQVTLDSGSITSVSEIDPTTGQAVEIPYGININGTEWQDPAGNDITAAGNSTNTGGVPAKSINISGVNVTDNKGATLDISGGGDMLSYRFVTGTNGTNDILSSTTSFAVIPSYKLPYAPVSLGSGGVYQNSSLSVGDQVYLTASSGLPAGVYTLLPARYALLPGAFLVTPQSTTPLNKNTIQPDGSTIVSGYRFNGTNPAQDGSELYTSFEVAPQSVVQTRAEYDISLANTYLAQSATANNVAVPRLPMDAGQIVFASTSTMTIQGELEAQPSTGGLGGLVDIASPSNIYIGSLTSSGDVPSTVPAGDLFLDATALSNFGADSLLIGGYRTAVDGGLDVTVTTSNLTLDNAGAPLEGPGIILVSKANLILAADSELEQVGTSNGSTLYIGNASVAGSGDGVLVRVGSSAGQVIRYGVDSSTVPTLTIDAGATISGANGTAAGSLTLDSTSGTHLDPGAILNADAVSLSSGQISLELTPPSVPPVTNGLILSSTELAGLQTSTQDLALLSYSSIDIYGQGSIGSVDSTGKYQDASLTLESAGIRGFDGGTDGVNIYAQTVTINSIPGATMPAGSVPLTSGALTFNATTINLGGGSGASNFQVKGYSDLNFNASNGVLIQDTASITSSSGTVTPGAATLLSNGNITFNTPVITAATGANETIDAANNLVINAPAGTSTPQLTGGFGLDASLTLEGASVTTSAAPTSGVILPGRQTAVQGGVFLPSGTITVLANTGDITIGDSLDAGGTAQTFQSTLVKYTSGGQITLTSTEGSVNVQSGGSINVSAQADGGDAGTLAISAVVGTVTLANNTLVGTGGSGGQDGTFTLDVGTLPSLSSIETALASGNFSESQDIRVRNSGTVTVDGLVTAHTFDLSADKGSIIVSGTGEIDASGATGGTINLMASGSVTLQNGSVLTVEGATFDDAGKGGAVSLEAGTSVNGVAPSLASSSGTYTAGTPVVDIQTGSKIILNVDTLPILLPTSGQSSITLNAPGQVVLANGTPGNDGILVSSAGTITTPGGGTTPFTAGQILTNVAAGSTITLNNAGTISFAKDGTGGTISLEVPAFADFTTNEATNPTGGAALMAAAAGDVSGTLYLRAPQTSDNLNVLINPINGTITGASSITVEGYEVWTPVGGIIDSVEGAIYNNGTVFVGNTAAMTSRLLANNAGLAGLLNIEVGAEIDNPTGDLTLENTWDLSTFRFGPYGTAGDLMLRAAGNLIFTGNQDAQLETSSFGNEGTGVNASLSDGFTGYDGSTPYSLWTATLMSGQSWSYRLVAGADFTAADYHKTSGTGSLLLGQGSQSLPTALDSQKSDIIPFYYQVIRTGTGSIDISTGGNVELLNNLATIYTAGSAVSDPTTLYTSNDFAMPVLDYPDGTPFPFQYPEYDAQYSSAGGNVTIQADGNIEHQVLNEANTLVADSSLELPTSWLYRRGFVYNGQFGVSHTNAAGLGTSPGEIESTSWWVDFSNFFEGVGALGGGNVTLIAGKNINNVDAVIPTNARMPEGTPDATKLVELGGGDLVVKAGGNINGGVYYVERGTGKLDAGENILTNSTRAALLESTINVDNSKNIVPSSTTWLPTTLFLGKGSFDVTAGDNLLLGPVANPFLLPQGISNSFLEKTYFSTYASDDSVNVSSLTGSVTLDDDSIGSTSGSLNSWYQSIFSLSGQDTTHLTAWSAFEPWLALVETGPSAFATVASLMPPILEATSFTGDINTIGSLTLSPSAIGTVQLAAEGSVNGLRPNSANASGTAWSTGTINLSDANPASIPGVADPLSYGAPIAANTPNGAPWNTTSTTILSVINNLFAETGSTEGAAAILQTKENLHTPGLLHADDPNPVLIYAQTGNISGLTLYSGEVTQVIAGQDITDIALYLQNNNASDVSIVSAGRDIIAYDPNSPLRIAAQEIGNSLESPNLAGDIQINGPGTLEVLAGRNLNLGVGPQNSDGTGVGISSIGNSRDPYLPFGGADVVAAAGLDGSANGFSNSNLNFAAFNAEFLDPTTAGTEAARYLSDLGDLLGLTDATDDQIWSTFNQLPQEQRNNLSLQIFYLVLRDAGRDHNNSNAPGASTYSAGYDAIKDLFPGSNNWQGDISLTSREIKTTNGGNISLLAPGGALNVGLDIAGNNAADQGIFTEDGGNINIFTNGDVNVGTSRIFTLNGGNEILWSSVGDIAAGASSKTVQSAPPTRVLVDPQSGDVQTDLAGLATGGGIGVLATVVGAALSDVDLVAPKGTVNAGDAGIRVSGNLNIAAVKVLNAGNIQVGGKSAGVPTTAAPNIAGLSAAGSVAGAANSAASDVSHQNSNQAAGQQAETPPSIIVVEVLGYGGGESDDN
ncbi:MAG: filamentous hemagglutinin family protein [Methylacidiphilales bacterium]|nr:filamentous hemagglutinin family protein [Candidatus Methylacidiphilales bacterium]